MLTSIAHCGHIFARPGSKTRGSFHDIPRATATSGRLTPPESRPPLHRRSLESICHVGIAGSCDSSPHNIITHARTAVPGRPSFSRPDSAVEHQAASECHSSTSSRWASFADFIYQMTEAVVIGSRCPGTCHAMRATTRPRKLMRRLQLFHRRSIDLRTITPHYCWHNGHLFRSFACTEGSK